MTIKPRLIKLEAMMHDAWEPYAITINVRDCRKGAEQAPIDTYELSVSGHKSIITRRPNESEAGFVIRATEKKDSLIVCQRNRQDIPPTPIMMQIVDASHRGRTA